MINIGLTQSKQVSHRIPWFLGLGYMLVFLLLDWASYIRPLQGLNITPWNPQPAFAIALLLLNRRWLWVVWVSLITAEMVVRGNPVDWLVLLISTAALSLVYAAIARSLTTRLDRALALATQKDLLWFTGIVVTGALISGVVYISALSLAGLGPSSPIYEAITRYWIGDSVGLIVMLPMLLVLMDPLRRTALVESLKSQQWWTVAVLTCLLLWVVFGQAGQDNFKYFYLLFVPVVWISAKLGVPGAVLASGLTQLGLIFAVQAVPSEDLTVFQLQVLMAAITMTGLLLGVAVDERTRATAELRGSLRLAAAGQMAAALAHELSQPLTALSTYAQACQMLVAEAPGLHPDHRQQMVKVTQSMVDDANRAGNVIKRLRDFFRAGSTNLQAISPTTIVNEAIQAHLSRAEALHLRIESEIQEDLPAVWMDPVQIAVVLRNLITNAIDSASVTTSGKLVTIRLCVTDGYLLIEVQDSGAGVDTARLQTLFDGGPSDKPGGMGVGLSICRAIVEAHGGKLWANPGLTGCFCFTLPVESEDLRKVENA
jgi:signal transduction histidine kinase